MTELAEVQSVWVPQAFEEIVGITAFRDCVLVATNRTVYKMRFDELTTFPVVIKAGDKNV